MDVSRDFIVMLILLRLDSNLRTLDLQDKTFYCAELNDELAFQCNRYITVADNSLQ